MLLQCFSWSFRRHRQLTGLNPCSNGIWSLTRVHGHVPQASDRLNPCSNGIWSLTVGQQALRRRCKGLNPCSNGIWSLTLRQAPAVLGEVVLILVLMEYGLWLSAFIIYSFNAKCLNPCSNGIWSLTNVIEHKYQMSYRLNPCSNGIWSLTMGSFVQESYRLVLILVLMEYGLWHEADLEAMREARKS